MPTKIKVLWKGSRHNHMYQDASDGIISIAVILVHISLPLFGLTISSMQPKKKKLP